MKFISVRELRATSARVFGRLARDKEIVITSNGKPVAVMSAVTGDNLENAPAVIRRARAMAAVDSMQASSIRINKDAMSLEAINSEIRQSRKERSR